MISKFKAISRFLTPHGLMERRHRNFLLDSLKLPHLTKNYQAVKACRYDLWPSSLRNPAKPWILLDVGANEGEFTAAAASLTNLAGVHAFEPQSGCHPQLNQVLQGISNSQLHPVAAGGRTGDIELLCTGNSKMASVLKPAAKVAKDYETEDFSIRQHLKVPLVRLDDVIPEGTPVGLLKIDVQGYELPVLEGAERTLRSTQAILMEVNYIPHYEGGAVFDDLFNKVRLLGFRTFGISAPYGGSEGPLWADAMFVNENLQS